MITRKEMTPRLPFLSSIALDAATRQDDYVSPNLYVIPKQEGLTLHRFIIITLKMMWTYCCTLTHNQNQRSGGLLTVRLCEHAFVKSPRCPLTSDGFVVHLPLPEHSTSLAWPAPGMQVLAFTTTVKRKATIDLVTESFTKPKRKRDSGKCKVEVFTNIPFTRRRIWLTRR